MRTTGDTNVHSLKRNMHSLTSVATMFIGSKPCGCLQAERYDNDSLADDEGTFFEVTSIGKDRRTFSSNSKTVPLFLSEVQTIFSLGSDAAPGCLPH